MLPWRQDGTLLEVSPLETPSYIETNGLVHGRLDFNSTSAFGGLGNSGLKLIESEIFCLIVFLEHTITPYWNPELYLIVTPTVLI